MTPREKEERAKRLLAQYVRNIKHYRTTWGIPPDKYVHKNAWAAAKASVGETVSPQQHKENANG